jgi:cation transporter-like permease
MGGSEVSQGAYGAVLLVHLAAPVVAAAVLLVAVVAVPRTPRRGYVPDPMAAPAGTPAA